MRLKKACAIICCAAAICSMTACSSGKTEDNGSYTVDDSDPSAVMDAAKEDVIQYLTNGELSSSDVVMTVNGEDVSASYLLYWIASNLTDYGYTDSAELKEENGDGETVGEGIVEEARDTATYYTTIRQKAEEKGLELDEDQQDETTKYLESMDENTLLYYATNEDDQKSIYESYLYSMDLQNLLYGDNGEETITDDDLKEYMGDKEYYTVDYMYFGKSDDDEDATAKAMERAESVYNELKGVSEKDFETKFSELKDNSDISELGHTFYRGDGEDEDLAEGLSKMEIGETGIIQTDFGVYVAHRVDLDTESIKSECAYDSFYDLLDQWSKDAKVKTNANYDKIDVVSFCDKLNSLHEAISNTEAEEIGDGLTATEDTAENSNTGTETQE